MCKLPSGGAQCWALMSRNEQERRGIKEGWEAEAGEEGHEQPSSNAGTSAHSLMPTGTSPQRRWTVLQDLWRDREPSDLHFLEIYKYAGNYRKVPGLSWPYLSYCRTIMVPGSPWPLPLWWSRIFPLPPSSPGLSHTVSWTRKARGVLSRHQGLRF